VIPVADWAFYNGESGIPWAGGQELMRPELFLTEHSYFYVRRIPYSK